MPRPLTDKLEPALFAMYMAILVWAPLPFASNRIWAGALLAVLVFTVLAGWLLLCLAGKASLSQPALRQARIPLALLVLVQAWVFVQLQYLPRPIVEVLSPQAYAWHIKEGWLSISLDREIGKYYLLRGCAFTAGFFLTLALVNTRDRVRILLQVLVFSGTFQAAYGAFMVLSGLELGFFVEKYVGQGVATGTFVNRNHLAGYLVMCLSAGIGLMMSQLAKERSPDWKERIRRWLRLLLSPKIRLRIYLGVMVVALVLTRARMGNIAFFVALGLAGVLAVTAGQRFSWRVVIFLGSVFVLDMLILGKWFGLDKLAERLARTQPEAEGRVEVSQYVLDYISHFPLTGSGGGTFYGILPNFQPPDMAGFTKHAHNDYLQFAAELGIPAAGVLMLVVALAMLKAFDAQRHSGSSLIRGACFAVNMTIIWAALHSMTDFNLQIPANALTFVTIIALAFVCPALSRRVAREAPPGPSA